MTFPIQNETLAMAKLGLVWRAAHSWSMAASATFDFGFVVGETEMVALSREYFTFSTGIRVELFEASFTGGTPAKTINRHLKFKDKPAPIQFFAGVTAGALGTAITGFEYESTTSNRVGKSGDQEPFIHDALKSYVLRFTNTGSGTQPFSFAVDFRLKVPGEF
ncbi:hypothetical protein D3C81_1522460 [compost metagenome]